MQRFTEYVDWIDTQQARMVELLREWASINTGTYNRPGLLAFAERLKSALRPLCNGKNVGGVEELPLPHAALADTGAMFSRELGNAIRLRTHHRRGPRVLLNIHFDTVYDVAHPFQKVVDVEGNIFRGPGVCDAKGGLVILLHALLAFERSPYAQGLQWEVLLNPDEEIGSPGSVNLFTEAASRNDVGLLFEPALPDGALVSSRKGSANFDLIVHGRAAHSGRDVAQGRNAIHALAGLISRLAALPSEIPGIVVNTGFVQGGGPVNIVPDLALARFNIRVDTFAQQKKVESALAIIRAESPRPDDIKFELKGDFHCPPKPMSPAMENVLLAYRECAAEQNINLEWRPTGGACDGNRLAAKGLPTVDSLGVRGGNIHTDQEFTRLDSLAERAKMTALFLMRLAAGDLPILVKEPHAEDSPT